MTSVKVKFRPSSVVGEEGTVYYQIMHNKQVKSITTGLKLHSEEWNRDSGSICLEGTSKKRRSFLVSIVKQIETDLLHIQKRIINLTLRGTPFTVDAILNDFQEHAAEKYLFPFMKEIIQQLEALKKVRTSETYTTALNSFMRFRKNEDIELSLIDSALMQAYEAYLYEQMVVKNTASFYLRILRAVYNRAVEKGLTPQADPFKHVYTGVDKTVKRALDLTVIKQIKTADLSSFPSLDYARDLFLFSFYTRGMSFVDMAYLKKTDLAGGCLSYYRRKTSQKLFVRCEPCLQQIIDKYAPRTLDISYLLPIIKNPAVDSRKQYKNAILTVNKNLKKLSEKLALPFPITTYVARHTWASGAKSKNIPLSVISECLGHDSEITTQIYLASLDMAVLDEANRKVLEGL